MIFRFFAPIFCILILLNLTMADKQTPTEAQKETEALPAHLPGSNMIGAGRRAAMNRFKGHPPVLGHGQNDAIDSPRVIAGHNAPLPENQQHLSNGNN